MRAQVSTALSPRSNGESQDSSFSPSSSSARTTPSGASQRASTSRMGGLSGGYVLGPRVTATANLSPSSGQEWEKVLNDRTLTKAVRTSKGENKEEAKMSLKKAVHEELAYGDCPESASGVLAWLDTFPGRKLGMFVNGKWLHAGGEGEARTYADVVTPADRKVLCQTVNGTLDDVNAAVEAASKAQALWANTSPEMRARHMYAIARHIQKHARLLAVIESLDNGKPFRESKSFDVPTIVRHFYNHAGWAQTAMEGALKDYQSLGVVAAVIPWNFPLMLLTWKVAAALATGNTVVVKPAPHTFLSALLLAHIMAEAGLPPGVFNVVTGDMTADGHIGSLLATHPLVAKLAFTGSTPIGRRLRQMLSGSGKKISLELGGKNPFIVFPDADLDSVVEGVVDAIWFNQGQVCCAGSRALVHESIYHRFVAKVKRRMRTLRLGHSLEKDIDIGPLIAKFHLDSVTSYVESARSEGADVYQCTEAELPKEGFFFPPTLITNVSSQSKCVREEIFGPVITVQTFETPAQAVEMANNTPYGLASSIWTENVSCAIEIAHSLNAGSVWVNCHSQFDASAPFGGYKQSGFGRDGGLEGLFEYVKPKWQGKLSVSEAFDPKAAPPVWPSTVVIEDNSTIPLSPPSKSVPESEADPSAPELSRFASRRVSIVSEVGSPSQATTGVSTRTSPIYYDGRAQRSDGSSRIGTVAAGTEAVGFIAESSYNDVQAAINSAISSRDRMRKLDPQQRAMLLFEIADGVSEIRTPLIAKLQAVTGRTLASCTEEVQLSIQRLRYYAARADKYGGQVKEVANLYGLVYTLNESMGVCGVVCPEEYPILGFVSLVAPLLCRGNSVVAVPSTSGALAIVEMFRAFDVAFSQGSLPAGALNVVTGTKDSLTRMLVESRSLASIWYHGSAETSRCVEYFTSEDLSRTWVNYGESWDWTNPLIGQGLEFLRRACEVKTVWVPMGDGQP